MNNLKLNVENKNKKIHKILMIGDDPRIPSGVANQLSNLGKGLIKKGYEIIVIGGLRKRNPEDNKPTMFEGIKIYPVEGYGNSYIVRNIIKFEKPDAIIFITDPRYFVWLWMMEDEIRTKIPLIYWNLWDDSVVNKNHYNKNYYQSTDVLVQISKQTNIFINNIFEEENEVELIKTDSYNKVINSAHKNAGMCIAPNNLV